MKALDDYIKNNPGLFNTEEPPDGHFERFDSKLQLFNGHRKNQTSFVILKIAAVIILGVFLTYFGLRSIKVTNNDASGLYSASSQTELNEAEQYYSSQLNDYYTEIKGLRFNNDKQEKKKVLDELTEMDKQVRVMKNDLKQNPDDERIVYAIINFYQVKIEIMNMIIAHAQQSTNSIL
jgi:hypothetical protein